MPPQGQRAGTYGAPRSNAPASGGGGVYGGGVYGGNRPPTGGRPGKPGSGSGGKSGSPKKPRSPIWTKFTIGFGVLLMVVSIGAFAALRIGLNELNNSVTQGNLLGGGNTKLQGKDIKGAINILMVGVDASGSRTDSIIIAHVPATHDRLYMVSLPRDTKVNLLGGGTNKINSTFNKGFKNLADTIKLNYGIQFDAGMTVNFNGFKDIVTKLGGVDLYVDETTYSIHHGYINNDKSQHAKPYKIDPNSGVPRCSNSHYTFDSNPDKCTIPGVKEMVYPKGMYHFNAYDALDFVRCRDGLKGTDYGRQRHQQQFIKAVMQKAYSQGMSNPVKLLGFVSAMKKAFTFDGNGISLTDWVFTLKSISPSSVITIKTNGGNYFAAPGPSDGNGSEQGLNADTMQLLQLVRDDKGDGDPIASFIESHGSWVG